MGEKRVIIDTNVLFSAFGWSGIPEKAILIAAGIYRLCVAEMQIQEISLALQRPKLQRIDKKKIDKFTHQHCDIISTAGTVKVVSGRVDNHVLEAAINANAEFIITGDAELLALGKYKSTKIVSPKNFIEQH